MTTSCSGLLLLASLLEDRPSSGMLRSASAGQKHSASCCDTRGRTLASEYLFHQAYNALFLASNKPPAAGMTQKQQS